MSNSLSTPCTRLLCPWDSPGKSTEVGCHFKTLMKEIKDDTNRWRNILSSWIGRINVNEYTTRSNLQIQCDPYQATNSIFHRTRTNNFNICMEIQKTLNNQLEKLEESTCLTSDSTTKPQSSKQYGTGTKTDI